MQMLDKGLFFIQYTTLIWKPTYLNVNTHTYSGYLILRILNTQLTTLYEM